MPRKKNVQQTRRPRHAQNRLPRGRANSAETISLSTSYVSLLYGILTLFVVFAIIFLGIHYIGLRRQGSKGVITDKAASTARINSSEVPSIPIAIVSGKIQAVNTKQNTTQPTKVQTIARTNTPTPSPMPVAQPNSKNKTYTVQAGDSLWTIAEKQYQSGYNWVSIAQANNLANPSTIHAGNQLIIPSVTPIVPRVAENSSVQAPQQTVMLNANKITGSSYTVQKGDYLWNIAIRAYGNGYKWVDIAKANNLTNPNIIHSGNVLQIPR